MSCVSCNFVSGCSGSSITHRYLAILWLSVSPSLTKEIILYHYPQICPQQHLIRQFFGDLFKNGQWEFWNCHLHNLHNQSICKDGIWPKVSQISAKRCHNMREMRGEMGKKIPKTGMGNSLLFCHLTDCISHLVQLWKGGLMLTCI